MCRSWSPGGQRGIGGEVESERTGHSLPRALAGASGPPEPGGREHQAGPGPGPSICTTLGWPSWASEWPGTFRTCPGYRQRRTLGGNQRRQQEAASCCTSLSSDFKMSVTQRPGDPEGDPPPACEWSCGTGREPAPCTTLHRGVCSFQSVSLRFPP